MDQVTIIGIDISKRSFQLHGATAEGKPVFGKKAFARKVPRIPLRSAAVPDCNGGLRRPRITGVDRSSLLATRAS